MKNYLTDYQPKHFDLDSKLLKEPVKAIKDHDNSQVRASASGFYLMLRSLLFRGVGQGVQDTVKMDLKRMAMNIKIVIGVKEIDFIYESNEVDIFYFKVIKISRREIGIKTSSQAN